MERSYLIRRLEQHSSLPFTLVSAPAGFGKSILISNWMKVTRYKSAWLSMDEEHNQLERLLEYIFAMLDQIESNSGQELRLKILRFNFYDVEKLIELLINHIETLESRIFLVFDDFHHIHAEGVIEFIQRMIDSSSRKLHVILITRTDPSLNLSMLRIYGKMNEVRMRELEFSLAETEEYIRNVFKHKDSSKLSSEIHRKTEGWITGIRLLSSLAEPQRLDEEVEPEAFPLNFQLLSSFLVREVIQKYSEDFFRLMILTATQDRFCKESIQSILTLNSLSDLSIEAEEFLEYLYTANLFLIPLDNQGKWYRYHQLFQDFLLDQARTLNMVDQLAEVHEISSHWYGNQGYPDEAIQYALKANKEDLAVDHVLNYRYTMMNSENWEKIRYWLSLLSTKSKQSHVLLMTTQAYYYDFTSQIDKSIELFEEVRTLLEENHVEKNDQVMGEYLALKAHYDFFFYRDDPISDGFRAMELLPNDAQYIKNLCMYWVCFSLQRNGKGKDGVLLIDEAIREDNLFDQSSLCRLQIALIAIHFLEGNLEEVKIQAEKGLELGKRYQFQETKNLSLYFLACVSFLQNDLAECKRIIDTIEENKYAARVTYYSFGILMRLHIEFHESGTVNGEIINDLEAFYGQIKSNNPFLKLIRVYFAEITDDARTVASLKNEVNLNHYSIIWFPMFFQLVQIKLWMKNDLSRALRDLEGLIYFGKQTHNKTFLIQALVLKTEICLQLGLTKTMHDTLEESLSLANQGKNIRFYLDRYQVFDPLLKSHLDKSDYGDFCQEILKHIEIQTPKQVNLLTDRELEVLSSLSKGLTNKDIADCLFISSETVKRHLSNIYKKMNVKNRLELVDKARASHFIN